MAKRSKPRATVPALQIPLNDKQLETIGRISVAWGQIDLFIVLTLSEILRSSVSATYSLLEGAATGVLIGKLLRNKSQIADASICKDIEDFCARMGELNDKRTHLFHGHWAWKQSPKGDSLVPACTFPKTTQPNPIMTNELDDILNRVMGESQAIQSLYNRIRRDPNSEVRPDALMVFSEPGYNLPPPNWTKGLTLRPGQVNRKPDQTP